MSVPEKQLNEFTSAYVDALLWSSVVEDENGELVPADQFELSGAAADTCRADCLRFVNEHYPRLEEATQGERYSFSDAGHDFALTRDGHGAGYWCRGDVLNLEISEYLTAAAKACDEVDLYLDGNEVNLC